MYRIERIAGISSTAFGYEFHITIKGERGESLHRQYNIHAKSMGRFYNLSNSMMILKKSKLISFRQYYKLFYGYYFQYLS